MIIFINILMCILLNKSFHCCFIFSSDTALIKEIQTTKTVYKKDLLRVGISEMMLTR